MDKTDDVDLRRIAAEMGRRGGEKKSTKPKGFATFTKKELRKAIRKSIAVRRKKKSTSDT